MEGIKTGGLSAATLARACGDTKHMAKAAQLGKTRTMEAIESVLDKTTFEVIKDTIEGRGLEQVELEKLNQVIRGYSLQKGEQMSTTQIRGLLKDGSYLTKSVDDVVAELVKESSAIEKLRELRNLLPDKYQTLDAYGNKIGNIVYSTSDIEGYSLNEMKAFSKYGSKGKNGVKRPVNGWVSSVENPAYSQDVLKVNSDDQIDFINGYLRNNDTEYKIIIKYLIIIIM